MSDFTKAEATQKWANKNGEFNRPPSAYRHWITTDADARFQAEPGRYHLYASYGCPWAHRAIIVRALKGLKDVIGLSILHPVITDQGWRFDKEHEFSDTVLDPNYNYDYANQLYFQANPQHEGRFTVPILWDKREKTIVNNESSEIIRMLNSAFNAYITDPAQCTLDLYPVELRSDIDALNAWVYDDINNGVYKAGFAELQHAYETNCRQVFSALDRVEAILGEGEFLVGGRLTEADIRLFTTIVRFDVAYYGIFKCNIKAIEKDYPHILRWARRVYQVPSIGETVRIPHIKYIYYRGMTTRNPTGVVPLGNGPDFAYPTIKPGSI
ncbi:S-glutathionyl-(chloro)hydroquinone reductase [Tieghemiomyces parasiticus]|uniref:S-glutathionyl-(Chloro)hydroquinone reductase n=1 Tax=Tieghemiomyces parasiticus TaxID=78921 RepID=A0A9W8DZY2_9FUNG|nr:S-glutathionyl-(chloro)hydroquinone reductase [Tieghemiomyces parasiticus]